MARWLLVHWPVLVAGLVCLTPFAALAWILIEELVDQRKTERQRAVREELGRG